jgi:putative spermidine/putrescine transport system substrate-binding protein
MMDEKIKHALAAMAGQPPHVADYSRRQFIANAARYGLTVAAAAALTQPIVFPDAALAAADVELPKIDSIPDKLKGSGTVRVCSYGGALQDAQRRAYFKPFEELSGIKVIEAEGPDPAKIKAMVDSKNIEYDVTELDGADVLNLAKQGEYWDPIDYSLFDVDNIDPVFRQKLYVNMLPYAQIYAYRTDAFKGKAPKDNRDLWDTANFPGPRSLQSGASGSNVDLELATMATGVPADKVYPIDLDKAFTSLGKIKPNVTKWWDAGAIPAQLLNDDEVVMATAWNGRIAAIQANKAPVEIVWQDQLLRNDCWAVIKGAANAGNAQKLTAFITMAVPQARLSSLIPYGFVNNKSAGYLSAERLKVLPTAPDIKSKLINFNTEWWTDNINDIVKRWSAFIVG